MVGKGRCTLVAGPLISLAPIDHLGPPTPARLAVELAERMVRPPDNYDPPLVAQFYAGREGLNDLQRYVANRLADVRYRPSLLHLLFPQLPFKTIIYTAQDPLLRAAFRNREVPVSIILPGGSLGSVDDRAIIQLYGSAEQPDTLKLTEDEQRQVFDVSAGLPEDLRSLARREALLFLGYTVNDPDLRDLYLRLRPRDLESLPRAYLAGAGYSQLEQRYWEQHNTTLYDIDALTFIQKLAQALGIPVDLTYELPPLLDSQQRGERDRIKKRLIMLPSFPPHLVIQMQSELGTLVPESEAGIGGAAGEFQAGRTEWLLGNLKLAKKHFQAAIDGDPRLVDAYLSLYDLLLEMDELDEAWQFYQKYVGQIPALALLPVQFEIRKILEQIDLGVSYCVFDLKQERMFTATILRGTFRGQEEELDRFDQQMRTLSSPAIGSYYGYGSYGGKPYILSEYIEGELLSHRLLPEVPYPYQEAMLIARQVADALQDGHNQGVPHLGLQPDNILLTRQGARLVNYGYSQLARLGRLSERQPDGERYDYLSPEQLRGKEGNASSDIYALGTILFKMLTGHTPGVGKFKHPSESNQEVTEAVDVLIDHARERYPDQRFKSAGEMGIEINRITLETMGGQPNQYLRLWLARVSHLYEHLGKGKSLFVVLPLLAVLLAIGLMTNLPEWITLAARILFPLLAYSLLISVPVEWAVREVARRRGLGSLISGGRGMGAILGFVFTLDLISVLGMKTISQFSIRDTSTCKCVPEGVCSSCEWKLLPASPEDLISMYASMLALVLFFTAMAIGIILLFGRIAERRWRDYTMGFYWSFVAIVVLFLILTILGQPERILSYW